MDNSKTKTTNSKKSNSNSNSNQSIFTKIKNFFLYPVPTPSKYDNSNLTVSGLNNASYLNYFISVFSGIFVFVVAPYVANQFNNTTLSALVNVFPTGILIALFIKESEFDSFFHKLLYAPTFNVITNLITYLIFYNFSWSPISIIILNISIWASACILAFFYG